MTERIVVPPIDVVDIPDEIDEFWIDDFNSRYGVDEADRTALGPRVHSATMKVRSWLEAHDDSHHPHLHRTVHVAEEQSIRFSGMIHTAVTPMLHPHQYSDAVGQTIPCLLLFGSHVEEDGELRELREGGYVLVRLSEIEGPIVLSEAKI